MPEQSSFDDIPCELLLNGVFVRSVKIRQAAEPAGDFDVVVTDPVAGCFALHCGFEIDLHETDSSWRRVSLKEFKAILKNSNLERIVDLPKASEVAECRLFARVADIDIPNWNSSSRSVIGSQDACVGYVQRIFYRVGIPHLVSGTVFTVPSVPTARIPLQRAGFRKSEISPSALVEPRTGCAIQLVERAMTEEGAR